MCILVSPLLSRDTFSPKVIDGSSRAATCNEPSNSHSPTVTVILAKGQSDFINLASGLGFGISFEASSRIETQLVAIPETTHQSSWSLWKQCST